MGKLDMAVKALKTGDKIDAILKDFFIYESDMLPHLKQEEDQCLPLLRAYFTPEEVAPKIKKLLEMVPRLKWVVLLRAWALTNSAANSCPKKESLALCTL